MSNGYGPPMKAFSDLLKHHFVFLPSERYLSVIYVDGSYVQGDSFTECAQNVIRTITTLENLKFYIKIDKSEIILKQQITFLGFIIDSLLMTIEPLKRKRYLKMCTKGNLAHTFTIGELAKVNLSEIHGSTPI